MIVFFTNNELLVSQLFGKLNRNIHFIVFFLSLFCFVCPSLNERWQLKADFG